MKEFTFDLSLGITHEHIGFVDAGHYCQVVKADDLNTAYEKLQSFYLKGGEGIRCTLTSCFLTHIDWAPLGRKLDMICPRAVNQFNMDHSMPRVVGKIDLVGTYQKALDEDNDLSYSFIKDSPFHDGDSDEYQEALERQWARQEEEDRMARDMGY